MSHSVIRTPVPTSSQAPPLPIKKDPLHRAFIETEKVNPLNAKYIKKWAASAGLDRKSFALRTFCAKLSFPPGHHRRRQTVARHIDRRPSHVHDGVNSQDQKDRLLRKMEDRGGR